MKPILTALMAVALAGCAAGHANSDQTHADEAAIRQTLADVERRVNQGDASFVEVFAKDAVIIPPSALDIAGYDAIRKVYEDLMKQALVTVHFATAEILVSGDLAYERGTYTLRIVDKASGKTLQDVRNKHIHIFKRQPDGTWKTWRMMVSPADAPPAAK
jgi:uncharacterized protein (TIGR02246 family)